MWLTLNTSLITFAPSTSICRTSWARASDGPEVNGNQLKSFEISFAKIRFDFSLRVCRWTVGARWFHALPAGEKAFGCWWLHGHFGQRWVLQSRLEDGAGWQTKWVLKLTTRYFFAASMLNRNAFIELSTDLIQTSPPTRIRWDVAIDFRQFQRLVIHNCLIIEVSQRDFLQSSRHSIDAKLLNMTQNPTPRHWIGKIKFSYPNKCRLSFDIKSNFKRFIDDIWRHSTKLASFNLWNFSCFRKTEFESFKDFKALSLIYVEIDFTKHDKRFMKIGFLKRVFSSDKHLWIIFRIFSIQQ